MKRHLRHFLDLTCLVIAVTLLSGCKKDEIDKELLYGTWYCPDLALYYTFNEDYSGRYYDSANAGKSYTWSLDDDRLEIKAHGDMINVVAFETYIIESLDDKEMKCHEEGYSSSIYTFTRQ